jgi:fructose-1,6-bisphosphatase/inositol monophosphatase family enzyme
MTPDPQAVAAIVAEVAAAEILPRFGRLAEADLRHKGPGDPVTVADEAAERALGRRLIDLLPGSRLVGEEAASADPAVLGRLAGPDPVWIVDPVDGTTNFAAGLPLFAVMVGLAQAGEMRLACIHDPVHGATALAEAGGGCLLDGHRVHVASPADPAHMYGTAKLRFGERRLPMRIVERCQAVAPLVDLRCAGHEYLMLCSGRLHFALYRKLMPWDHAPGNLLHREAGGHGAHLDGRPYRVAGETQSHGFLYAPDETSWHALVEALIGAEPL